MKKGASPAQIFEILEKIVIEDKNLDEAEIKTKVIEEYNSIYSQDSKDTKIANLRESAMVQFQEERIIVKLPQDNNKVDLMAVKLSNNIVDIKISQQKGNNASFNSTSLSKTIDSLSDFVLNNKVKEYFNLLPDNLNPEVNGMDYKVEVVIGMFLAEGKTSKTKHGVEIKFLSNNDYLRFMGIINHDIIDLDYWVIKQFKLSTHNYNAVNVCTNFDEVYDKCLNLIRVNGNK